ncbi:hypothetical protein ACWHAN_24265 [Streptomyces albidoflavus]|uniref:hypothetical protein n=1 Tax=Streptomyces TaxID=1883 RepID=UPI002F91106D|nr:hypothetical protein OHA76_00165 [Streptomyces albidoflavus]WSD57096.1 hypothetical protein OHA76_32035 [Streptomyces albidoflavus]WTC39888.1 hypothetical protein OH723_31435 [Streptomyces albidoflavus]
MRLRDPRWALDDQLAGLLDAGLLVRAEDGTAVLADDVRYSLRLTDADDISTYWHTSWQNH